MRTLKWLGAFAEVGGCGVAVTPHALALEVPKHGVAMKTKETRVET